MSEFDYLQKYDCQNEFPRENNMYLGYIASDAKWSTYSAENIIRHMNLLRVIPGYETKAKAELVKAELALSEALLAVQTAILTLSPRKEAAE